MTIRSQLVEQAVAYFVSRGWAPAHAAGIVANLYAESRLRPDAVGDGGQAYGVAQWHPDRQQRFAELFGKSIVGSSLWEQMAFVHAELGSTEKAAGDALRACVTAAEAGACVSKKYERPADREGEAAKRAALAAEIAGEQAAAPIEDRSTTYQPPQEAPMPIAASLLASLIPQVLGLFSARAQATIAEKTGADPQLAQQFVQGVIRTVGDRVGIPVTDDKSAIQAVGKLTADVQPGTPAAKDLEDHSLDYLHKLTEAAQAIVDVRKAEVEVETSAMDAASTRNDASEVRKRFDSKVWWAYGIAAAILGSIAVAQVLMGKPVDGQIIGALILAFGGLGSAILMMGNYGYGSSGSSGAKDALIGEMAARRQQPTGGKQ